MAKLPRLSGREMVRFLEKQGFIVARVRGSHHFMDRGDQRTSVPVHGHRNLKAGTLRGILRDIGMSPSEFERLWTA
jgi:predicted RNA binding protein YcfA (HicA-like mRNA interferase family)